MSEVKPISIPKGQPGFVETPYVEGIIRKAMRYVRIGYPINFSGPAGTGKTTLALHIAAELAQPVILIHGDEELGSLTWLGDSMGSGAKRSLTIISSQYSRQRRMCPRGGWTTG